MLDDDKLYDVAVTFVRGIGDINAKKLITHFGSAKDLFSASLKQLKSVPGIGEVVAMRLYSDFDSALAAAEEELKYVYANDVGFVTFADDTYPERLRECADSPAILYYKGMPDFSSRHIVSIVGTRNATKYGVEFCKAFVAELAQRYSDAVVVSGLAYGIDVAAHIGGFAAGFFLGGMCL